ncbi:hypothetical protein GDO86_010874 [Hymenochirus boettgeri]|uniref:Uncharacterized protein n=1 Tax=Hymenochirus boettgeri TaxID=247094 RepID=A0A8T2J9C7_9PIPI|nr:hypothetical protein GDO86_010874 [Hymenochirus boettgeri]
MEFSIFSWVFPPCCTTVLIGLAVVVLVLVLGLMKRIKGSNKPPGPFPLPFLGNILSMDFNNLPLSLSKLRKRYGNIFSLQLFHENVVVLNGYDTIKEGLVLKSEDTADRPPFPVIDHLGFNKGLAFARYGQQWKELRRFAVFTLKNFGMGKKTIEERVREEARYLCEAFQNKQGHPFDPFLLLHNAVSNVMCSIVVGERFEYSNLKLQRMIYLFREMFTLETGLIPQMFSLMPWLMRIPGPHQKVFKVQKVFLDFLQSIINKHMDTWDPGDCRDFIDAFIGEIKKANGNPKSSFNEITLLFTTANLFVGGSETTSITLRWAILMMLLNPHIQDKVHEEINQVIGHDRTPTMKDQINMPYTNAVIHETQRYGDIFPMSLFHMAYRDTKLQGFNIPKGTTIIANLTSVLKDETKWEKPHKFYPEHFLDGKGHFVQPEAFIPFSAGKRVCAGEPLARMELFIFFTTLLQHFDFQIPGDQATPCADPVFAFTHSPLPFQICAMENYYE